MNSLIRYLFAVCLISFLYEYVFYHLGISAGFVKRLLKDRVTGIPKCGGLGIVFSFYTAILLSWEIFLPLGFLAGLFMVFLLGLFDDILNLSALKKFIFQFLIAVFFVNSGIRTHIIFFPQFFNYILSIIWIVGIMNAFNFLDILDGLAAGISIITALTFAIVGLFTNNQQVFLLAFVIAICNLFFFIFNFPKARLYMGDTGSLFNGAFFACLAILISYASVGRETLIWTPLLILALPLFDLIFVVVVRFFRRVHFAKKSPDHFALLLLRSGFSNTKATIIMYLFNMMFCASAVLFFKANEIYTALFLFIVSVACWLIAALRLSDRHLKGERA